VNPGREFTIALGPAPGTVQPSSSLSAFPISYTLCTVVLPLDMEKCIAENDTHHLHGLRDWLYGHNLLDLSNLKFTAEAWDDYLNLSKIIRAEINDPWFGTFVRRMCITASRSAYGKSAEKEAVWRIREELTDDRETHIARLLAQLDHHLGVTCENQQAAYPAVS
jgi:hypothetical protein